MDPSLNRASLNHTINGDDLTSVRGSEAGSFGTYNAGIVANVNMKPRDIEEEEYIYKVACDPRETISLRDSRPIPNEKAHKKRDLPN